MSIKELKQVIFNLEELVNDAEFYGDSETVAYYLPRLEKFQRQLFALQVQAWRKYQARPVALLVPLGDLVSFPQL